MTPCNRDGNAYGGVAVLIRVNLCTYDSTMVSSSYKINYSTQQYIV